MTETTEEFAGRVVGAIDAASVAILLSIGHQTHLFDTLAASIAPTTRSANSSVVSVIGVS